MTVMSNVSGVKRIAVVIVNWNSGAQLENCVMSVIESSDASKVEIIVVDNGSTDGSMASIANFLNVKRIYAGENLGFGRACNRGAIGLKTEFILFLNPDASVYTDTVRQVLDFMDSAEAASVGICGVQLLENDKQVARSCSRFPTPMSFFYHAIGLSKISTFSTFGSRMAEWDHQNSQIVDQLIGAFFFVRRDLFEGLRGFDERYFVYFEEVDFSLRAKRSGWNSFYLSSVQAFHAGGGTSNQVKARRLFYSLRSRLLYSAKNFSVFGFVFVFFSTIFMELISRLFFAMGKRSWSAVKETSAAYLLLLEWVLHTAFLRLRQL